MLIKCIEGIPQEKLVDNWRKELKGFRYGVSGVPPACDGLSRVEADCWPHAPSQIKGETIINL